MARFVIVRSISTGGLLHACVRRLAAAALLARFRLLGTHGLVGMAISAIDMAMWDALARSRETSLCRMLGASPRPIPAYGGIGYDGETACAREAERWAKRGFKGVKAKIGYPNQWRDYSTLKIASDDLLGNMERAARVEHEYQVGKLSKPVDHEEWLMSPQTVNAYYNPVKNEIVFPAAILQAPFFDFEADDAVNYGAIGAVIGHEIGHGFDDQGRRFDGTGALRDRWTPAGGRARPVCICAPGCGFV